MIRKETTWKNPAGSWTIIKNLLDPTVVMKNCTLYVFSKNKLDTSYCTIQTHKAYVQLSTLVTKKKYRGNKYGKNLLDHVIKDQHKTIYLIARDDLTQLYTKRGFKITNKNIPLPVKWRYIWSNTYNTLFRNQKSHVLRRK